LAKYQYCSISLSSVRSSGRVLGRADIGDQSGW
jgi:hypothetical protein